MPSNVTFNHTYVYSGYYTGTYFDEKLPPNPIMTVRRVIVRDSEYINMLQFWVSDGVTSYYMTARGGTGGSYKTWDVPTGEYITQIEMAYGEWINSLTFITDKGKKSPKFGGNGQNNQVLKLSGNLVSFFGGAATDRLNWLGFYAYNVKYET